MVFIQIFILLPFHWFGDFIIQSDDEAKNKSTSIKSLLFHTSKYSLIMFICGLLLFSFKIALIFGLIQFITHTVIDYFTSKINSKLWKAGKVHNFFVSTGFDQCLHYIIMFGSLWILIY